MIDALPSIALPVLVLVGERDEAYLRAADVMAARIAGRAPHVADAGHVVNLDAPEAFEAEVVGFLERLSGWRVRRASETRSTGRRRSADPPFAGG